MKFLVDAQLPQKLSDFLNQKGHDSVHTIELKLKNKTGDTTINRILLKEKRVLITKDGDFEDSFLLKRIPPKLILVTTGNIPNSILISIFENSIPKIVKLLKSNNFLEIDRNKITVRS